MSKIISPAWQRRVRELLDQLSPIDETISYNPAAQWLVQELTRFGRPYTIHQLGAGVKRITTNTTTCPCCGKSL